MSRIYEEICKIETKCDNCGTILKPFEGMLSDLCDNCRKKGIDSEWDKIKKIGGK
jgi:uncharacterized OB-fold protein